MLRPRIALRAAAGGDARRPSGGRDRAMDVLLYVMAILALAVAHLLAAIR